VTGYEDKDVPPKPEGLGRPRCGGKKKTEPRKGEPCQNTAGWGTAHVGIGSCRRHGGNTPNHVKAANQEKARQAVNTFGLPREIGPAEALLEEVKRTAGIVAWLDVKVQTLEEEAMVFGVTEVHHKDATEFSGTDIKKQAAPNVWVDLHQKERKHLVAVCKTTLDAGVDAKLVEIAEGQGLQFVEMITETLTLLDHDMADPKVLDVLKVVLGKRAGAGGGLMRITHG
jgi:hypothetical protein